MSTEDEMRYWAVGLTVFIMILSMILFAVVEQNRALKKELATYQKGEK